MTEMDQTIDSSQSICQKEKKKHGKVYSYSQWATRTKEVLWKKTMYRSYQGKQSHFASSFYLLKERQMLHQSDYLLTNDIKNQYTTTHLTNQHLKRSQIIL